MRRARPRYGGLERCALCCNGGSGQCRGDKIVEAVPASCRAGRIGSERKNPGRDRLLVDHRRIAPGKHAGG